MSFDASRYLRESWQPDEVAWFEYHCYEGHDSSDAEAWYRSHQRVTVLGEADHDGWKGSTAAERAEACTPIVYRVRFQDGLEWDVFEDELLTDSKGFYRPDPPQKPLDKTTRKA